MLVLLGDGATSEGDTHEALNFAGCGGPGRVSGAEQRLCDQRAAVEADGGADARSQGRGYGMPADLIDGNDAAVVYASVWASIERGRWRGPTLIEAETYRIEAHTNADDATRYRDAEEVAVWQARDPLTRLAAYLQAAGELDPGAVAAMADEAERFAADVREPHRDRHGDERHYPGRRDAVQRVRLPGVRADHRPSRKLHNRTRGRITLPAVVRIPYGGGIGGVEHHCDSSEAYYAHTPGLRV